MYYALCGVMEFTPWLAGRLDLSRVQVFKPEVLLQNVFGI